MVRETTANAFFSYSDNYLIDTDHSVIIDVEATRSIRQAEVGSTKTMLERLNAMFDLHPERLIADTAYGTGPILRFFRETIPKDWETFRSQMSDNFRVATHEKFRVLG